MTDHPGRSPWIAALVAVLASGLALRLLGIDWGLPGQLGITEHPFHPDEAVAFSHGGTLYTNPGAVQFSWGGALYFRLGYLARLVAESGPSGQGGGALAPTILLLRLLNVGLGLATTVLVAWIGLQLHGRTVALTAASLMTCFPNHVLSCHYARPDVLVTFLATGALACACAAARMGCALPILTGALLGGLAAATMLWGAVSLVPVAVSAVAWSWTRSRERWPRTLLVCAGIPLVALCGYAVGSFESLLFPKALREGFEWNVESLASDFRLPWNFATTVSFYGFGTIASLSSWAGLAMLLWKRRPGTLAIIAYAVVGWILLGRVSGDMMRYLLFLAPVVAITAALALVEFGRVLSSAGAARLWVPAAGICLTLQLSLSYVLAMQFAEDPRYRSGRWLAEHAPRGSRVGVTRSFAGDETYLPRPPPGHQLRIVPLMLRHNFDASGYLELPLDYIATTDYAEGHARGPTAPQFFEQLRGGDRYRPVAEFGPPWTPLSVPDWLGSRRPSDLLYVRSTHRIFQRIRAANHAPSPGA